MIARLESVEWNAVWKGLIFGVLFFAVSACVFNNDQKSNLSDFFP